VTDTSHDRMSRSGNLGRCDTVVNATARGQPEPFTRAAITAPAPAHEPSELVPDGDDDTISAWLQEVWRDIDSWIEEQTALANLQQPP